LVSHPTGAGKTVTFAHLLASRKGRHLVLVHRDELVNQTVNKLAIIAPELSVGVVKADRNEADADVVVASVQTLIRENRRSSLGGPHTFSTIIVDEAHHATAFTWQTTLSHFGAWHASGPLCVGFTATPSRGDGTGLGQVWEEVVHRVGIRDMIDQGYLVPIRGQQVGTNMDLGQVRTIAGDYSESGLDAELTSSGALEDIAKAYVEYASDRKGVAYTPTVLTAERLAEELNALGVKSESVSGATPTEERRSILDRLHTGVTQVVTNCMVLTEGFDEPSIDCIVVARPTKSQPLFVQMVGRGTRLHPNKRDLLVLDVAGATDDHDLCSVTNLALDTVRPAVKAKPGEGEGAVCAVCQFRCNIDEHWCSVCRRPLNELMIDEKLTYHPKCRAKATREINLFASKMRWMPIDNGYCLPAGKSTLVLVPRPDDTWTLVESTGSKRVVIRHDIPIDYAQGIGEEIARDSGTLATRNARWLRLKPTDAQLRRLAREGLPNPERVKTRGEAADLITRLAARRTIRRMK
jgi:superfamily II DNA or RNA helicase